MSATTLPIHHAACAECWSGYPGIHSDHCSHSTALRCRVCGGAYHQGTPDGRCLLRDEAHRDATAGQIEFRWPETQTAA